eukprot:scaffold304_cov409-Prasinococcus_capsulatus_cf.AAC.14
MFVARAAHLSAGAEAGLRAQRTKTRAHLGDIDTDRRAAAAPGPCPQEPNGRGTVGRQLHSLVLLRVGSRRLPH